MIQFMKILGPVVVCIMIHRFLELPIGIRRDDFRVDEPFDVGTFGREQAVDIIRAQDAVRGMIVVEPVDPLDPVGVPLPFFHRGADFPGQRLGDAFVRVDKKTHSYVAA